MKEVRDKNVKALIKGYERCIGAQGALLVNNALNGSGDTRLTPARPTQYSRKGFLSILR